jgi:cell division protein FtsL
MKNLKRKFNTLSKIEKRVYVSISVVLTIAVLRQFYNAGEAIGTAYYHLTQ